MLIRFKLRKAHEGRLRATICIEGKEEYEGYLNGSLDELKSSFDQWQKAYLGLENIGLRLTPKPQTTTVSKAEVQDFADSFKKKFNKWLKGEGDEKWQKVLRKLAGKFDKSSEDEIKIFLDVDEEESILRRFPWQDWDFFQENCSTKEVVLYDNVELNPVIPLADAVKVLVVIGNNEDIEQGVQEDLNGLRELERKNRGVFNILEQPTPHELLSELRSKSYQIFIFTGHSRSDLNQKIGWIELSKTDSLTVSKLKSALSEAIDGGLQLCILNSCDGLGFAKQLIELKLPLAIVMREPVPDDVAAKFLRVFLDEFSSGQSFFKSFREARDRLEGFSLQYPGVCWLPTIYTGIEEELPTWSRLRGQYIESKPLPNPHSKKIWRQWSFLTGVAFTSIAAFIAIWVIRDGEPINPHPELFSLGDKNLTP
ncbi:MAG: CHAT domain-containing protein, partial [Cyanobacteria bacterium J06592_8]